MNHLCRACNSPHVTQVASFSEYPSTGFGLTDLVDFVAYNCANCGLDFISTSSDQFIWRLQSVSSLRLNEPTDHLSIATKYLQSIALSLDNPIFLGYSYKDNRLLSYLQELGFSVLPKNWDLLPEFVDKFAQLYLFNSLVADLSYFNSSYSSVLVLTKAFEHIFDSSIFTRLLSGPSSPNHIYLELSNFAFDSLADYSLWNERASYFDRKTVSYLLQRFGYSLMNFHCYGSGFFMFWSRNNSLSFSLDSLQSIGKDNSMSKSIFLYGESVINSILDASNKSDIGIFGTGHKGISLAQRLSAHGITVTLFDGNINKVGTSIANLCVRSVMELPSINPGLLVLAVPPHVVSKVRAQIISSGFMGSIFF